MKWNIAIVAAAILAYLPSLNNGFIADDWVILQRIELLKTDPLFLLNVVPENFRLTSYAVFGALKAVFGYVAPPYYVFNIALHAVNCLLLRQIVFGLASDAALANFSALLFAVFQAPQEAVAWLAAMNETLLGFFAFLAILCWIRGRYVSAAAAFFAFFSKESGLALLAVLPLMDLLRGVRAPAKAYLALAAPGAIACLALVWTLSVNFQVSNGTYSFGAHAALVLIKSLHRLVWPWGYVVLVLLLVLRRRLPNKWEAAWAALIVVTMLPYVFVTYVNNLPSRQLYMASAAYLPLLATLMIRINRSAMGVAFVAFNLIFMWDIKDRQMEERSAPTSAMVETLRLTPPGPVVVSGFPYAPLTAIARAVAVSLPGWESQSIELGDSCRQCILLRWDASSRGYQIVKR